VPFARLLPPVEPDRTVERVRLAFFHAFLTLVLLAVAASQWAVLAWCLPQAGVALPAAAHVAGPAAIWLANRALLARRAGLGGVAARVVRGYSAVAFTSVFCGAFLLAAAGARGLLELVAVPAIAALGATGAAAAVDADGMFVALVDAGLAGIAALFAAGYTVGRRALEVTLLEVQAAELPPALDGLRLVHVTDLHIGEHLRPAELATHVERINRLAPDLVCITGDLVDRAETCGSAFPVLAGLRARHGVFVTLGNHDVGAGAEAVTAALRALTPFTVLRNALAVVRVGDARLAIAGLDDLGRDWARGVPAHPALPGLVRAVPPGVPLVVLSHRPDCFPQAAALGAALVLSGHTHGGQLGLPSFRRGRVRNLAEFISAFDRGVFRDGTATLLVNRGLGFTGQPVRIFSPREIACVALRAASPRPRAPWPREARRAPGAGTT